MMKKSFLNLAVIGAIALTSCENNMDLNTGLDPVSEANTETAVITMTSSDYERIVTTSLERDGNSGAYTAGVIEYKEDGALIAKVDFSKGELDEAIVSKDGKEEKLDLKKKKSSEIEKVIVEPIVKSDDCDYIVAGIVEYYEKGKLVATVDFGDGECDDLATKTTAEGSEEFSLDMKKEDDKSDDKESKEEDKKEGDKDDKDYDKEDKDLEDKDKEWSKDEDKKDYDKEDKVYDKEDKDLEGKKDKEWSKDEDKKDYDKEDKDYDKEDKDLEEGEEEDDKDSDEKEG